jgi:hypothetical protein
MPKRIRRAGLRKEDTSESGPGSASPQRLWYSARVLFVAKVGAEWSPRPLWEERITLVRAHGEAEARQMATEYALAETHAYDNQYGERVEWVFHSIEDMQPIDQKLTERGWEVMSRFVRYRIMPLPRDA